MSKYTCGVVKLVYLHHFDDLIGNELERTILFTLEDLVLKKKTVDWLDIMLKNNILLKIIIRNKNSVSLLLKSYDIFTDITEKNISEINKMNLDKVDHTFALELFTSNLLLLN